VLRSLLQFTYTTLFGGYVTFIYLRTGSLLAVVLVHVFCNWMGFPRFWGRLYSARELSVINTNVGKGKRSEDKNQHGELGILWTVAYYLLLVIGAVAWSKLLWPLTESESGLTKF
jgi:prenyl protein peptidase